MTNPRFTLLGGLRVEHTSTKFDTYRVTDGVPTAIAPRRKRTDWLPGLHARFDLDRKTTFRASYTETLARPTFSQLNPRETRSTTSDTVSRGNINLKPVFSRNYDLSVERYLGADNYVSAGVFHKEMDVAVIRKEPAGPRGEAGVERDVDRPRDVPRREVRGRARVDHDLARVQ